METMHKQTVIYAENTPSLFLCTLSGSHSVVLGAEGSKPFPTVTRENIQSKSPLIRIRRLKIRI